MSSDEIRRIVVGVEAKMGWTFRHKDVCEILQYTEQKARQNGKGQGYVPILFENELRAVSYTHLTLPTTERV